MSRPGLWGSMPHLKLPLLPGWVEHLVGAETPASPQTGSHLDRLAPPLMAGLWPPLPQAPWKSPQRAEPEPQGQQQPYRTLTLVQVGPAPVDPARHREKETEDSRPRAESSPRGGLCDVLPKRTG